MKEDNTHPTIPRWKLERYRLGELPLDELRRIDSQKEMDPAVARGLQDLEAEDAALRAAYPTGKMAGRIWKQLGAGIATRPEGGKLRFARLAPVMAVLLVVCALPFWYWGKRLDWLSGSGSEREITRVKGGEPALFLYRKSGQGAEALGPDKSARGGDLIQVYYQAAGRKYGAIYSLDGTGKVTWHLPESGHAAVRLDAAGIVPLPSAFELDDAPGGEHFHFLAADHPFNPDSVLALPSGESSPPAAESPSDEVFHSVFILTKEKRP